MPHICYSPPTKAGQMQSSRFLQYWKGRRENLQKPAHPIRTLSYSPGTVHLKNIFLYATTAFPPPHPSPFVATEAAVLAGDINCKGQAHHPLSRSTSSISFPGLFSYRQYVRRTMYPSTKTNQKFVGNVQIDEYREFRI